MGGRAGGVVGDVGEGDARGGVVGRYEEGGGGVTLLGLGLEP